MLQPESDMSDALDPSKPTDAIVIAKLNDVLGNFFSSTVAQDAAWAREILGMSSS